MWKKIAIGAGVVVLAIGSCVGYFYLKVRWELKPVAESILKRLDQGRVAEVYLEASAQFKRKVDSMKFRRIVKTIHKRLGHFKETVSVGAVERKWGGHADAAAILMTVRFSKGKAKIRFSFIKQDDKWRLLGMHLEAH